MNNYIIGNLYSFFELASMCASVSDKKHQNCFSIMQKSYLDMLPFGATMENQKSFLGFFDFQLFYYCKCKEFW